MGTIAILCRSIAVHDGNGTIHGDVHQPGTIKYRNSTLHIVVIPAMGDKTDMEPHCRQLEDKTMVDIGNADTCGRFTCRSGTDVAD